MAGQRVKKETKPKPAGKTGKETSSRSNSNASSTSTAPKRNRVPISCTICRRRKVKCDKRRPVCTACETNGVAHLCHYIDPIWAQPLSNSEIATGVVPAAEASHADSELVEKLKEKIKDLEAQVNAMHGVISPSTISDRSDTAARSATSAPQESNPYENLNLSKKFDMLHIKTTTTVHLGATSWLAIMKGDPYLRVLWAHIFKLRKQAEEKKFRQNADNHNNDSGPPTVNSIPRTPASPDEPMKLPVRHLNSDIASPATFARSPSVGATCPVSGKDLSQGKCPVIHTSGKCPIDHETEERKSSNHSHVSISGLLSSNDDDQNSSNSTEEDKENKENKEKKDNSLYDPATCPVSGKGTFQGTCPVAHDLQEEQIKIKRESTSSKSKGGKSSKRKHNDESDTEADDNSPETDKLDDERVCPLMMGDNSFLDKLNGDQDKPNKATGPEKPAAPTDQPDNKRRKKSTRSNSTQSSKDKNPKVTPEDFKQNPVMMMQRFLPKKKALWLLIDRFFEILYIYMPFVDEESFREELKFIFGERDDEDQKITIKIRSGVDFALVGTVCIIMRLTWNTLPMNNIHSTLKPFGTIKSYPENKETVKFLQKPENEVPIELVECVKHCFSNLKLMRKSSLKIVQCALYMKLYFVYSPQDGDGADGSDSQIFLGMIIQMAISIGLHRDPKNFENFANERQRHLWRKIWFELISLDIHQSMNLGCPRSLQNYQEFSDTKLPGETEDGLDLEEFKDDFKELTIIKNIHTKFNIDTLISKTMEVLLNVNVPATRTQVDGLINELQKSINGFGKNTDRYALSQLGKILVHRTKSEPLVSSATRAIEFRLHVMVNMMIYLLNYILFVHFEPIANQHPHAANIAKNYAQKALDCALDGYRNCTLFFDAGLEYFGPGVDLVLSPLLLLIGHRSIQFMVSLILRSRCGPFMKPTMVEPRERAYINPKSFIGALDAKNGFHNIDNRNHELDGISISDNSEQYRSVFNVDVNSGEILATILLEHMDNFHTLAEKLGSKYPYSWRMSKAVGFFITLLKKPINVVKSIVKTENVEDVENNTGHVSSLLNSIPLNLSVDEENQNRFPASMNRNDYHQSTQFQQPSSVYDGSSAAPSPVNFRIPQNSGQSPFGLQRPAADSPTPVYSNFTSAPSDYAPTPGPTPTPNSHKYTNSFSLSFGDNNNIYESMSNNPINTVDVDVSEQFPELVQATESFSNFNDDKAFGDMFGLINGGEGNPTDNVNGGINSGLGAGSSGYDIPGIDFNNMMGGSWFS